MSLFSPPSFPLQHRISRSALTVLAIALAALAGNAPAFADEKPQAKPKAAKPNSIQIIPAAKAPAPKKSTAKNSTAKPTEDAARVEAALVSSAAYRRIYRSIPFSRSLHDVNPGYRHDATMELLTGKSRRFSSGSNGQTSTDPTR